MTAPSLVFGVALPALHKDQEPPAKKLAEELSRRTGLDVSLSYAGSYDALVAMFDQKKVHLAWLPPIPFIGLERAKVAVPLVSHHRGGVAEFDAVLVVSRASGISTLDALTGTRAAWVDPLSASGYVMPRIQLYARGIDPRTAFASERFFGSHEAVIEAIVGGHADFGGTHARLDASGAVVSASWSRVPGAEDKVRSIAAFGAIPADVTVARSDVDPAVRAKVTEALLAMSADDASASTVREVFGVDELRPWAGTAYEAFRQQMADAALRGLLDAVDATGQWPSTR